LKLIRHRERSAAIHVATISLVETWIASLSLAMTTPWSTLFFEVALMTTLRPCVKNPHPALTKGLQTKNACV
jgi:hypothetical protein